MPDDQEKYSYGPEDFGDLFRGPPQSDSAPPSPDSLPLSHGSIFSTSPDAQMRLLYGQNPSLNAMIAIMRRDRLLSAFPNVEDGAHLLESVLPEFMKQFTEACQAVNADQVMNQILFDFFTDEGDQIEAGGQELMYIFINQPPVEQSYEYIGEKLMRLLRKQFHQDTDPGTQAFFGWIGRRLMKTIRPETDFSLDRHAVRVEAEKVELADAFAAFRKRVDEGVEEPLTLDKAKSFFKELSVLANALPTMGSAETPTMYRVSYNLGLEFGGGDLLYYLPYRHDPPLPSDIFHEETFERFVESWRKEPSAQNLNLNYVEYCRKHDPDIFNDIPTDDREARALPEDVLLPKWFAMIRRVLSSETEWVAKDAQDFTVSYFRFIRNKPVAAGYAFAQQHSEEIFAQLPHVLAMTEAEVQERFMVGDPKILYDEHDFGRNTADDMYEDVNFEEVLEPVFDEHAVPPPIQLTEAEKARSDEEWLHAIGSGPNAALYDELYRLQLFSEEDWVFGVQPLFFGIWLSDHEAYLADRGEERAIFYEKRREMTPIDRERERIEELKAGQFALPQTVEDLVINATRHIQRLESQYKELRDHATTFNVRAIQEASLLRERLIALQRVRGTIRHVLKKRD